MAQNHFPAQENKFRFYDVMTTSDNHYIRYGIWYSHNQKKRGSVFLLNGRKEFMEKHVETIGALNQRGFDVYSLDWRGQGLWSRMLANRHKGFIKNYDTYIDDLKLFVRNIVQPKAPTPLAILAQKKIYSLLSHCIFTEITGARHEILKETDAIQSIFWDEFDRFTG